MSSIAKKSLFAWNELENLGDLQRLKLVLDNLPDAKLISVLRNSRCKGRDYYPIYKKRYIRISMKEDERIFTPLTRPSYKWKKKYNKRTSVERVNCRIDQVYCFEKHFIKGQKKMKLRLSLAFCVMLAMAVGRIKENEIKTDRKFGQAGLTGRKVDQK